MKKNHKLALFYILLMVAIVAALSFMMGDSKSEEKIIFSDLKTMFINGDVKSFEVDENDYVIIEFHDEDRAPVKYKLRDFSLFYNEFKDLIDEQINDNDPTKGVEKFEYTPYKETPWWVSFLPTLAIIILIVIFFFVFMSMQSKAAGGKIGGFGRAKVKVNTDEKRKVLFSDVAGADEEKEELEEIVDFLRAPLKYTRLGAKIPHGVLLVGPPGTGKTLLAKAVAGEAGVPFFSISGSDFVEMYVGVGASRVRDLFETAKKHPASIVFIDEIDAVGRHRGAGLGGGHDEREQTLNQLLVEMDGFGSTDGIIVIAATNRPDILDPALLRPGRFDRQITVNYPDLKGREAILKVHSRNKPLEDTVDFVRVAQSTVGFTGADLANLLNEAALLAARRGKSLIGMDEIEDSYMKILVGPKKKSKIREEKDNKLTAFHEAGHAVAAYFSPTADPVKHITIVPAGRTGGVTVMIPEKDSSYDTRNSMFDRIVVALGGRVAEELKLDDISSGASSDISHATAIARNMVTRYGMSEKLGTVLYGSEHSNDEVFLGRDFSSGKNYSEATAAEIDAEIKNIIDKAYRRCAEILYEHSDKLQKLAEYLIKVETVDGDQFKALMEGDPTFEELDAIAEEKRRKSQEENDARRKKDDEERKKLEEEEAKHQAEMKTNGFGDINESPSGENPEDKKGENKQ